MFSKFPVKNNAPQGRPSDTHEWFATTHWTIIFQAKDGTISQSAVALNQLCHAYRAPIYAYLRRSGHSPADAEDLTQDFFAHLLHHNFLQHLQHRDGKFRSFLLKFLKHFLSDVRDKARAIKRGGKVEHVSLDALEAEVRDMIEPATGLAPDEVFEKKWALTVMERSWHRLRDTYRAEGKEDLFEFLKDAGSGNPDGPGYAEVGAKFGLAEGTIKSAVHRMRQRHREILRDEIARTVASPDEIDPEIQNLLRVLGR